jgi:small subunit ribosomal protein S16
MVKIRLTRLGDKKSPFYRVIVADSRTARDGKAIEFLGTYDPLHEKSDLDAELAKKWLANGAQPTATVRALLVKAGAMPEGKKAPAKTKAVKKQKSE